MILSKFPVGRRKGIRIRKIRIHRDQNHRIFSDRSRHMLQLVIKIFFHAIHIRAHPQRDIIVVEVAAKILHGIL